jgi:hypothetical protein
MASSNHLMSVDVNVFSLAGSSLLDSLQSYTLELPNEMAEGKPIRQLYGQGQVVKKSWKVSPSLMSSVGGTADTHTKVNSAYLSAFTLTNPNVNSGSARDYLATVRSLSLKMDATTREAKGSGDVWAWPEITAKKLTWELEIMLPGTIGSTDALMTDLAEQAGTTSDHLDGHLWTPSFTLNGVTITAAGVLANFQHVIEEEGLQVYRVTLDGRAPDDPSTAYPAAPTGTTSLLEKALNQRTAIAVSIRNRQTGNNNSIAWAGNALIVGATVNIPQSGLVRVDYTLEGQGALTPTKA